MNEASIKRELEYLSDEHLCKIVVEERDSHDLLYLKLAEEVLAERGFEIEYETPDEVAEINHLELSNGQVIFSKPIEENLDISDRINNLVDEIEQKEQTADHHFEQKYQTQNDHDFLKEYLEVIDSIYEAKEFGGKTQVNSLKNVERLSNNLAQRNLNIPEIYQDKYSFVMKKLYSQLATDHRREGNIKLITGIFIIIIPAGLILAGLLRISLVLILVYGIIRVSKGVSLIGKANELKQRIRY